jgi:hypothetical protein
MSSTNTIINPIPCIYDCNTRIYWDTSENAYLEVFTKKKHICPNRSNGKPITNNNTAVPAAKPIIIINLQNNQNPKCPIPSNCLQDQLQIFKRNTRYCQILFLKQMVKFMAHKEIGIQANGKVHGSQRDRDPKTGLLDLLVYFEVPDGKREECKQRFNNIIRNNQVILQDKQLFY